MLKNSKSPKNATINPAKVLIFKSLIQDFSFLITELDIIRRIKTGYLIYDSEINKLKVRINVVKKQTQAQLDAVNNFGNDELERFFSERYQRQPDSIN